VADVKNHEEEDLEKARIRSIEIARAFHDGTQYDVFNEEVRSVEQKSTLAEVPEHLLKCAYSTQIEEAVAFVASELSKTFEIRALEGGKPHDAMQKAIDRVLTASPDLSSGDDPEDVSIADMIEDILVAGDVPVHIRYDRQADTAWWELWDSESVWVKTEADNRHQIESVLLTENVIDNDSEASQQVYVRYTKWYMVDGVCWKKVWRDNAEDDPESDDSTGLTMFPWGLVRARKKRMRDVRGYGVVTSRAQRLASRYDGAEMIGFTIARYNSHGNLVVVGDGALALSQGSTTIAKDVADVITFPDATQAFPLKLESDITMIENQRKVVTEALYASIGLVRIDQDNIGGLGGVSGYALEILNRKSDSTLGRIAKQIGRDIKTLMHDTLQLAALARAANVDDTPDGENPQIPATGETIDVATLLSSDSPKPVVIDVTLGTGSVVNDAQIREDYTAGLISRKEALRLRGYGDDEIKKILEEIDEAKPPEPEVGLSAAGKAALAAQEAAQRATGA
jgi:hypothetical protein